MKKRVRISDYIALILKSTNITHIYTCTDLDKPKTGFTLTEKLKSRTGKPVTKNNSSIPVQITDITPKLHQKKETKYQTKAQKTHHC